MEESPQRDIPLPSFNRTDVGPCQAYPCGECPLGEAALLPGGANGVAQKLESAVRARSPCSHGVPVKERTTHRDYNGAAGDAWHQRS
jgi:hypothetical protein